MLLVELPHVFDPHLNLAVEEYLLRNVVDDEPVLLFYVNDSSVLVGRNQNVFEEIDLADARERDVPVLRRLSGGGTVFHDRGNLNYSLITPRQELLNNFAAFTRPVVEALADFGIRAELRNRSSIFVDARKISGNAQYATAGKLVSHGTLLFDTDLALLRSVLKPRDAKIESRSVQSVRSSVGNLRDLLDEEVALATVRESLKRCFVGSDKAVDYEFSDEAWRQIHDLAKSRYQSWSWNIGHSPKFTVTKRTDTALGELVMVVSVQDGLIQEVRAGGEAGSLLSCPQLSDCLHGVRYDPDDLANALAGCVSEDLDQLSNGLRLLELLY